MRVERGETDHCRAQHGLREVEAVNPGSKVVALLRDRKYQRNVVQLVAPRVQVYRRIENSIRRVKNHPGRFDVMSDPETRSKTELVWVQQAFGHSILAPINATSLPFSWYRLLHCLDTSAR